MATGGAQKVLLDQARWFHERGHKVTAAFFYDKENFHQKWQAGSAFPIINLNSYHKDWGALRNLIPMMSGFFRLWRLLRSEKYDAIETFTHDSNMLALPVAWLAGVPARIATHHGVIEGFPRWRDVVHAWMVNHNIAQELVSVSVMTRQIAIKEGVNPSRISVIQNGIKVATETLDKFEARKELGIGDKDLILLSVGRLVYQKAHEILISAMPVVLEKFPNAKVIVCGDGILRKELEAQIEKMGLGASVKLPGKFDSVLKYLVAADVFVLPSRWEGLPIALLEAMSVGLPVVATNVAGVDETLAQGRQGLLVPVEDVWALSYAIVQILSNPSAMSEMGIQSRQRALDHFTEDTMCEKYLEVFLRYIK